MRKSIMGSRLEVVLHHGNLLGKGVTDSVLSTKREAKGYF